MLLHEGREYPIQQHGFARDSEFTILTSSPHAARLRLKNSPATEARFPFAFSLDAIWSLDGPHLNLTFILTNTGQTAMPASLRWHPAFHWDARQGWELIFSKEEPDRIRRVNDNVQLTTVKHPSPVLGMSLSLTEAKFDQGAMIFEAIRSRGVRYSSPDGPVLDMAFPGFAQFAVWKQPGADFVCLEPWSGLPATASLRGELQSNPFTNPSPPERSAQILLRSDLARRNSSEWPSCTAPLIQTPKSGVHSRARDLPRICPPEDSRQNLFLALVDRVQSRRRSLPEMQACIQASQEDASTLP